MAVVAVLVYVIIGSILYGFFKALEEIGKPFHYDPSDRASDGAPEIMSAFWPFTLVFVILMLPFKLAKHLTKEFLNPRDNV